MNFNEFSLVQATQKRFLYEWKNSNYKVDTMISIPPSLSLDDELAVICSTYKIPVFVRDDLRSALLEFLDTETTKFYDDQGDSSLNGLCERAGKHQSEIERITTDLIGSYRSKHKIHAPVMTMTNDDVFREAYQSLLNADLIYLRKLLKKESEFAKEMQNLVKERDWEVEKLKKEHGLVIEKAVAEMGVLYSEQQVNRMASEHFERLHLTESNYASQILSLATEQRKSYRELILHLNEENLMNDGCSGNLPFVEETSDSSLDKTETSNRTRTETTRLEESFTIHLGAQQKTMHNLRLSSMDPIELCRQKTRVLEESRRLQMALSLYSGQLHGVVLLVDSRPNYHLNFHTDFASACEQATELHFPDLEAQLHEVSKQAENANECRILRSAIAQSENGRNTAGDILMSGTKNAAFKTGDVYLTRHSNLSNVHVAFHLVVDDALKTQEINSRHPCINGLRNIIRLCYKFDVTTISLPLLLIRTMTEELTVAWCVKRAELVFKCVKGFMMECATLSGAVEQYTVQFLVPPDVSADVFHQLADMLLSIFHLAKPVVATPAKLMLHR